MTLPDMLKVSFEFSPKLGVRELPRIDRHHESNVKGLYIVGDLADAPIIKVALRQGYDVAHHVADRAAGGKVVVIGAGPAGIGASLALSERGIDHVVLERELPFATIQNFPKGKLIFSEPVAMENPGNFWFEDATKEDLVDRWQAALEQKQLPIEQPIEVVDVRPATEGLEVHTRHRGTGEERVVLASKVILAAGKRGEVRRLGVSGDDLPHVHYTLKDPDDWANKQVVVVGGGDSAVESACSLADAGAQVTVSYRQASFHRAKLRNQQRIAALHEAGRITVLFDTTPREVTAQHVVLDGPDGEVQVPADGVLAFLGAKLPRKFLRRLGIRMQGDLDAWRLAWILGFAALTYAFYCLKAKRALFPFHEGGPLHFLFDALSVDLGFRTVDAGFWGTCIYSLLIAVFGLRAYRKYHLPEQKKRYLSLVGYQLVFLFGVPELLAPLVIERPWKVYALTVPWPLSTWSLIDAPSWAGDTTTAVIWLALAAFVSFVAVPLYVRRNGVRFCSYLCGCGGLAETLGDFWRHLAPRGRTAKQAESFGRLVLVLAIPVTLLVLNDAWQFFAAGALYETKAFAEHWYGLMVDFWLASIVGVALYPYLGNRVWCRFFCPLRAWMEELAKRITTIVIRANDKCIGCNECTRFCQMGIDVMRFAQKGEAFSNHNSACIQCGICVQVCPMEVLSVGHVGSPVELKVDDGGLWPPRADWER